MSYDRRRPTTDRPKTSPPYVISSEARNLPFLQQHVGLLFSLVIYLLLTSFYFFIVPIFEAPDEWTHTGHVKYMAEGHGLPVMLPGQGIWGGQQPPLYYAIGALLVQPFDLDDFDDYLNTRKNPHASLGYALDPGNKNNFLHTPAENFPYQGLALTIHILRLYSMAYGLIALIFIYLTAIEIYDLRFTIYDLRFTTSCPLGIYNLSPVNPKSKIVNRKLFASLVALFVACQPMFAFITASVANEPANIAFCAIGVWLAQRYVLRGPGSHWGRAAALGITLGLVSLAKMTGLSLGLVIVVALLLAAISARRQPHLVRLLWRDMFIIGPLVLAVGGWWYWRNYQLYGDFFQRGLYKLYFNVDPQPLTLSDFLYTLSTGEVSFWATFGWLNLVAPDWVYSVYRIISRIGLIGVTVMIVIQASQWFIGRLKDWRSGGPENHSQPANLPTCQPFDFAQGRPSNLPLLLHLVFPAALAFSLTRLVATEGGLQGRQLLPALGSIAIVIIYGWWTLVPSRLRLPIMIALMVLLLGLAVWLPWGVVAPEYIPKPLLTEADLPPTLNRLDWTYRDEMKLLGVTVGTSTARPGERVPVTAYWQALKPMDTNYSVFVHLIGHAYTNTGQFNTYPGLGLRPTQSLQPGQIVADTYPVLVAGGSQAPTRLLVNIGLFDFNEAGRPGIQAITSDGQPASATAGQLKLIPNQWPPASPPPPVAEFNDHIWLADYTLTDCQTHSQACEITFKWQPQGKPSTDYTVFIQLWPADPQQPFIGFDGPPLAGEYPTSLWETGEVILDPHFLDLTPVPPGQYRILAGLYNFTSGDRVPATQAGTPLPGNAINLGNLYLP